MYTAVSRYLTKLVNNSVDPTDMAKVQHLVVDASAFIKNVQLQNFSDRCYTVHGVINEIQNNRQLRNLAVLPYNLEVLEPDQNSLAKVVAFAKKTGDYASLSKVDLQIIALTYQLHVLHVGEALLQLEPKVAITVPFSRKSFILPAAGWTKGFYMPKEERQTHGRIITESETSKPVDQQEQRNDSMDGDKANVAYVKWHEEDEEKSWCEDYGDIKDEESGGWITPFNIAQVKRDAGSNYLGGETSSVACMTTDFAVQNVLRQIGLHITAVDGCVIRELRTHILRCYACFKTTSNMTKTFCPRCGNDTLKKVAVSLNEDGQQVIHINSRRNLSAKCKNRPVAKFDGGKHSANPLIYEDQPLPQQRISSKARRKTNTFAPDYATGISPFVMRDVDSRSALLRASSNIKQKMQNLDYDNKRRGYAK